MAYSYDPYLLILSKDILAKVFLGVGIVSLSQVSFSKAKRFIQKPVKNMMALKNKDHTPTILCKSDENIRQFLPLIFTLKVRTFQMYLNTKDVF